MYFFLLCLVSYFVNLGAAQEEFVVGTASGYAPYVSLNEKGAYEGFDIDLAEMVAKRLNKKLVLQDLGSMPSLLMALNKKKIDAVIWAVSITSERQKKMDMIYYQGEITSTIPVMFWKNAPAKVEGFSDLARDPSWMVAVEAGSYQEAVLLKYPAVKLKYLDKITDAIMDIKCGKSVAAVIDNSLVPRVQGQYPEIRIVYFPLPEDQQSLGNGICIHRENRSLSDAVKKVVADLQKEGKIAELEKKWNLAAS